MKIFTKIDNEGYRELGIPDLIDITKIKFPVFDSIPNELPRDTRTRWRVEYMDLCTRQLDWISHMLATAWYGFHTADIGQAHEREVLRAMQDVLNIEADRFIAHRWLYACRFEVSQTNGDAGRATEFHSTVVLYGGHEPHKIHLTPLKP